MTGLDWRIDGTPAGDRMGEDIPTYQVGESLTYQFLFEQRPSDDARTDRIERHETVRSRLEHASDDYYETYSTIAGPPRYRDTSPDRDRLVSVDVPDHADLPRYEQDRVPRVWGLIVGGQDTSSPSGAVRGVDLEVFVLAHRDDFAVRADVRHALEANAI